MKVRWISSLLAGLILLSLPLSASAITGDNIRLNAYVDFRAKHDNSRDNKFNVRAHHLGLILNALQEKTQFYGELDWEDTPELFFRDQEYSVAKSTDDTKNQVTAVWVRYLYNKKLNITAGKFLSPLSFYNQRHFPILNVSIHRPVGAEAVPDDALIGIQLDGRFSVRNWGMRYFAGAVQDWTSQMNDKDENDNRPLFGRLEITPPFLPDLAVAFDVMKGTDGRHEYDSKLKQWKVADKTLYSIDINLDADRLFFEALMHYTKIRPATAGEEDYNQVGAHVLARYDLTDWVSPWAMLEYADANSKDHVITIRAATVGLNFPINDYLKIKSEFVYAEKKGTHNQSIEIALDAFF